MRPRRTMRRHAFLIALAVMLSPLILVMSTNWTESLFADRTREHTEQAASEISKALAANPNDADTAKAAAEKWNQRVRILRDGQLVRDDDQLVGRGAKFVFGDVLYGPERKAVLGSLDRDYGELAERLEVKNARTKNEDSQCRFIVAGNVYVCSTALRFQSADGHEYIVHVEGSSRRALQTLYESRRQLVKLLLFAGALGLVLAWWTMRSFVKPVEALRNELLHRATQAVPKAVSMPAGSSGMGRARELTDLTDAFNTVMTALGDRTRTNEEFLADLAHEFKNPVAAVRACAERMSEPGALDEVRKDRLAEVLKQSSTKLDSLVTQFLELARAEAGLPNEDRERVELAAQLKGLTSSLAKDPRYEKVKIEFEAPQLPLEVMGVPQRLEMALRNLLENAASFAGDGGWVRVRTERSDTGVRIYISDSGPGIPQENLPKLFDRFFSRRGDKHGTGLGLALVRAVVEAHGGSVAAESPAGSGATFIVSIPFTNTAQLAS